MRPTPAHVRLALIPLLLAVLAVWMHGVRGPYSLGLNVDPEYPYLLNIINLATGNPSVLVQHPGTPLQIVGTLVVVGRWLITAPFHGFSPLPLEVMEHSDEYLLSVNVILVLLLMAVAFLAGRRVHEASGSLAAGLAVQATPLVYLPTVEALPRVAPELPELIIGLALAMVLAPVLMGPNPVAAAGDRRLAMWTGILIGAGVATKANFFVLGLLVFLFSGWRQWLRFAAAAAIALAALLLPIVTELRQFIGWFVNMALHSGHYGQGEEGLPALTVYWRNFVLVFDNEPFVFYFTGFYLIVLIAIVAGGKPIAPERRSVYIRMLVLTAVMIALHTFITAKHFNYHYMLPAALLTAVANGMVVHCLDSAPLARRWRVALIALGLLLAYEGLRGNYHRMSGYQAWKQEYQEQIASIEMERKKLGACRVAGFFRSTAPTFALNVGNGTSGCRHEETLETIAPGGFHYSNFNKKFLKWNCASADDEVRQLLAQGECIVLQGEVSSIGQVEGFHLEPLFVPEKKLHGTEGLFRLLLD